MNEDEIRAIVRDEHERIEEERFARNREGLRQAARDLYQRTGAKMFGTLYADIYDLPALDR